MTFPSRRFPPPPASARRTAGQGARGLGRRSLPVPQALVRLALAWLLLALVAVPALGRLHQVAHGGALDRVHAGLSLVAQGAPDLAPVRASSSSPSYSSFSAAGADHSHALLPLLLGHHAPADCVLLDQLALGDALHSAAVALPDAVPAHTPPADRAAHTAASHVALFQARGPPLG